METYNLRNCNEETAIKKALSLFTGQDNKKMIFEEGDTWLVSWKFQDNKPTHYFQEVKASADLKIFFKNGCRKLKKVTL